MSSHGSNFLFNNDYSRNSSATRTQTIETTLRAKRVLIEKILMTVLILATLGAFARRSKDLVGYLSLGQSDDRKPRDFGRKFKELVVAEDALVRGVRGLLVAHVAPRAGVGHDDDGCGADAGRSEQGENGEAEWARVHCAAGWGRAWRVTAKIEVPSPLRRQRLRRLDPQRPPRRHHARQQAHGRHHHHVTDEQGNALKH